MLGAVCMSVATELVSPTINCLSWDQAATLYIRKLYSLGVLLITYQDA